MMPTPTHTRVYLEEGKSWTFAAAVDWPGWCRRGKGEDAAVTSLLAYAARYVPVAGPNFAPGRFEIVGRLSGDAATDFGVPGATGPWDDEPLDPEEADRQVRILEASWSYFDSVVSSAPPALRKGPRGGGRDRDAIVDHVAGAERSYSSKVGARVPPRTPWPEQRATLVAALRGPHAPSGKWPRRYAIRRCAWHVLDHAWEIEDKSTT
jgi:hypothetical protein